MTIAFPQYSSDFGSSTCPDYACRPTRDNLPNGLPNGFTPILFAAHHVANLIRFEHAEIPCVRPGPPDRMPDRSQGLVELVKIFQPSLQLLVMHLTKAHCLDGKWDPEWNVSGWIRIHCNRFIDSISNHSRLSPTRKNLQFQGNSSFSE